ncbi:hypothetical protein HRbin01_01724 [archaeon HR01]|nr:hypothetical protein HRbin01_01724 [archaeon HR01]
MKTRRYDTTATRIIAGLIAHAAKILTRIKKAITEFLDTLLRNAMFLSMSQY